MIFNKHVKLMHAIGSPILEGKEATWKVYVQITLRLTWPTFMEQ